MARKIKCRRKTVKRCKRAFKSCQYVNTKKSRYCKRTVKK